MLIHCYDTLGFAALAILVLCSAYLRYTKLNKIPGPFICTITDGYRAWKQNRGQLLTWLESVHAQHGPVVRIGPNTLSVSDAKAVPKIYTSHGEFKKADSYQTLRTLSNGVSRGSLIDMQDEQLNTKIRRAVLGAFSAKNVLDYEDDVDHAIEALIVRLGKDSIVSTFDILEQFQADFFRKAVFSISPRFLMTRTSTHGLSFQVRFAHWQRWQGLHRLEHVFYQTWFGNLFRGPRKPPKWVSMSKEVLDSRLIAEKPVDRKPDLLDKFIEASKIHPDVFDRAALLRLVGSTFSAGFDTTAHTITFMLWFLCRNPNAFAKLRAEIDEAVLSHIPRWNEVNKMPYLDAVIKEAMRMAPFLNLPLEREVPLGGTEIAGYSVPEHTTVGCHPGITGQDPSVFGSDPQDFRPERWLEGNAVAMGRSSLVFGNGKRLCIGMHIAEMEMKKAMPALIKAFDFFLTNPDMQVELDDGITSKPKIIEIKFVPRI